MGQKTESRSIQFCDVCKREDTQMLLTNCFVCEKDFCTRCEAPPRQGTYFNYRHLCKECAEKPMVKEMQEAFRALFWNFQEKEKEWFERLGKTKE